MKLIDIAPLNVKHYTEISEIIECLDENIKSLSYELTQPGDIEISYCQDSEIQCTGSREYTFDQSFKQVHAYLDKNGDINYR